ncbi:hypothetical protein WME76_29155 [Sorangium sp. So ce119]|uniref:hypothetical protein n=1 Tax=Sorangium sp. So ce119 TaxID=3133279 RepID=UPI003F5F8F27
MSPRRDSAAPARKPVIPEDDPVWQAVLRAPTRYDEEISDEERAAVAAGANAPGIPREEVIAELRRRAEAEGAGAEFDELMRARRHR